MEVSLIFLRTKRTKSGLAIGSVAPDFTLPSHKGEDIRLSGFREKKNVVLYFYPKDETKYCIAESIMFRDKHRDFSAKETEILGISSDNESSHRQFSSHYNLSFNLLSDAGGKVRKLYGVPATFGVIPGRVTFVIDKKGVIRNFFSSQFNPHFHVEESLKAVSEIA